MFRKMLREKQQLTEAECLEILRREPRGVLSVLGDGDYPYGMPMNHYYNPEDGCVYFHCGRQRSHRMDALRRCNQASFCVMDRGHTEGDHWALHVKSVILFGHVDVLDDPALIADISARLRRKFTQDEAYIAHEIQKSGPGTLLLRLRIEHMSGKYVTEE